MEIVNKVAQSGLMTIDLEEFILPGERILFDLKSWLYEEQILKENEFRESLKNHHWEIYQDKHVAVTCSVDAVVPTWAYMLIVSKLSPLASTVTFGSLEQLEEELFRRKIRSLDQSNYRDQRVVIKGCSKANVPVSAYLELTAFLRPLVKSIMYGEPCSTVPVFKRKE